MIKQTLFAIAAIIGILSPFAVAQAGPEFVWPVLLPGTAFESTAPRYRLVGIGLSGFDCTARVVADPEAVFRQASVNKIVLSVERRLRLISGLSCPLSIDFYSGVDEKAEFPAFALDKYLGGYLSKDNRVYFMGDVKTYGGWVDGPVELRHAYDSVSIAARVHSVDVSVELPDRDPLYISVTDDEAKKLTGEKLAYWVDFWIRAAFAKAGLEYSIGKTGAAHEITAINGVRNGAAGRWVYFVDGIRSPYHIDSQSSENMKAIRFVYEETAAR